MDYGNTGDMRLFAVMNFYYIDYLCRPITIAVVIFLFWWGLANEMYIYGSKKQKKTGLWINRKLNSKFGIDIELGAVKRGNKITPIPTLILYIPMKI
ncbi:hypothetical protein CH309_21955 [Salmonella enterica subsp. enterica serovar Typhimurium]|uniref:hypothetical protein n=1 Tax=Salmonella enterica TaxID=28901 RepID=UPI000BA14FF0|nr:hypothetical protein [Salmonella enterica]OZQ85882.1 hypothetical protein CH309_21955 [Salmonella enterica subsp. enterica serovar Typhimurium]